MALVPENTLERLQQRRQILTPPVTQTQRNLDSEMTDILSSKELDDEQKARVYNQSVAAVLDLSRSAKRSTSSCENINPKAVETPKSEENEQPTEEPAPEKAISSAVEREVMKSVPKIYQAGARQLLDKIKEHQDVLHWNDKGELLYETKPIPGSHLVDLVNDTLRHRKGFEPVRWSVFARGLA